MQHGHFFIGVNNPFFENYSFVYLKHDDFNNIIVATVSGRHAPPSNANTQLTTGTES